MKKAIVINDLHVPFHDYDVIKMVTQFIKDEKPDELFLNGDIVDMWEISRFTKDPRLGEDLKEEIEIAKEILSPMIIPKKTTWIFGNHEFRFDKFLFDHAKALVGLKGLTLQSQMEMDKMGVLAVDRSSKENYIDLGPIVIGHFNHVNKYSGYSAKNLLDKYNKSLIQGHTHRGGTHYRTRMGNMQIAYENFCLCDLEPTYVVSPDWQHGLSILHYDRTFFQVMPIPISNGQFFFDGEFRKIQEDR
jgi:UDP-2,3-diacylglucosamine pyrophosphatase LpxH